MHINVGFPESTPAAEQKPLPTVQLSPTPFSDYDNNLIAKINQRWLLSIPKTRPKGIVVLDFKLTQDGKVRNLRIQEETVDQSAVDACKLAVIESAPFPVWPDEMRRIVGRSYREIRFRFSY